MVPRYVVFRVPSRANETEPGFAYRIRARVWSEGPVKEVPNDSREGLSLFVCQPFQSLVLATFELDLRSDLVCHLYIMMS